MAVNATDFHSALKRVCDVFKIPSLYSEREIAPIKTEQERLQDDFCPYKVLKYFGPALLSASISKVTVSVAYNEKNLKLLPHLENARFCLQMHLYWLVIYLLPTMSCYKMTCARVYFSLSEWRAGTETIKSYQTEVSHLYYLKTLVRI